MCTWSESLSNLLSCHCICLCVLINDLQVRKQRKAKGKQPFESAPKSTPLAARRKFYPLDGTSLLPLGLAVAEGALRRLKTQSSLPSSLQVLRVEFLASLAAGMLFASTSELVPKPGDEWGWWVGPRNEFGRVPTPPFLRVTQKSLYLA
jgi:hypothetical protein